MNTANELRLTIERIERETEHDAILEAFEQASLMYEELVAKGWAKKNDAQIRVATEMPLNKYSINY